MRKVLGAVGCIIALGGCDPATPSASPASASPTSSAPSASPTVTPVTHRFSELLWFAASAAEEQAIRPAPTRYEDPIAGVVLDLPPRWSARYSWYLSLAPEPEMLGWLDGPEPERFVTFLIEVRSEPGERIRRRAQTWLRTRVGSREVALISVGSSAAVRREHRPDAERIIDSARRLRSSDEGARAVRAFLDARVAGDDGARDVANDIDYYSTHLFGWPGAGLTEDDGRYAAWSVERWATTDHGMLVQVRMYLADGAFGRERFLMGTDGRVRAAVEIQAPYTS